MSPLTLMVWKMTPIDPVMVVGCARILSAGHEM